MARRRTPEQNARYYANRVARREAMVRGGVDRGKASRIAMGRKHPAGEPSARDVRKIQTARGEKIGRAVRQAERVAQVNSALGRPAKSTQVEAVGPQVTTLTNSPADVLKLLRAFPDAPITLLGLKTGHRFDAVPIARKGETLTGRQILERLQGSPGHRQLAAGDLWDAIESVADEIGYGATGGIRGAYVIVGL